MEFKKYQHLERYGNDEVRDIEYGEAFIFPKLDGTNASVWLDENGIVQAGSRNRHLSLEKDNAGFYAYILENENIEKYLKAHPTHRLYGEWLVPHSLKTYREDAWRKFYIFDITIAKVSNGNYEAFIKSLDKNQFLIKDGEGNGEGIVIKNYNFYNKYKRQTWAKIVTTEFKEIHNKAMGYNEIKTSKMVEEEIVEDFCTTAFIEKEYAKIVNDNEGWSSKFIPMLLSKIFHELITEEIWNILKKYKNPKIDFKTLNHLVVQKIKQTKREIFN